jgi:hypothetical protein
MQGVWFEGMRISTLATLAAFGVTGFLRGGDVRALWSALAWIGGFEAAYQVTAIVMRDDSRSAPYLTVLGVLFVWFARKRAARPQFATFAAVGVVWAVWISFGFHANLYQPPGPFSLRDEVLNETAKTLWALAYLLPLWQ